MMEELRAIMQKGPMIGVIALTIADGRIIKLGTLDPREGVIVAPCSTPEIGRQLFEKSIKTSVSNGWKVIWRGDPKTHGM